MTAEGEAEPPSAPSPAAGVNMLIQESWRMTFHFQNAETPLAVDAPHDPLLGVLGYSLSRLTPWKFPKSVTAGKYSSAIKKKESLALLPFPSSRVFRFKTPRTFGVSALRRLPSVVRARRRVAVLRPRVFRKGSVDSFDGQQMGRGNRRLTLTRQSMATRFKRRRSRSLREAFYKIVRGRKRKSCLRILCRIPFVFSI